MKPQKLITNRADGERGEKGEEGTANVLCTDLSPSPTTLRRVSRSSDTLRERREGAPLFGSGRSRSLYAETGGLVEEFAVPDGSPRRRTYDALASTSGRLERQERFGSNDKFSVGILRSMWI